MSLQYSENKRFIDAKGQVCPYPLIIARKELKNLKIGEVLEIEVDYENSAIVTIPEWCRKNDVPCETVQLEDRLWRVYIMKIKEL